MTVCSVREISKMYGGNLIFDKLTMEIQEQDRIGIVGRNGGGKTTLFKLLSGIDTPDSGQIYWKKGLKIGYLAQIPDYPEDMLTKEVLQKAFNHLLDIQEKMITLEFEMKNEVDQHKLNRIVELYGELQEQFTIDGGYEIDANIERIANGLNIESLLNNPFGKLSGGEKTKVGLGLILLQNPNLLFLDEPTNHLDLMAVEWLGQFLKKYHGTVVVISHDRYFLDEVVTKVIDLEDGEIQEYHGNYSIYVKEKEERLLREFQAYQEQQKKIKKMKEAIKRLREWANQANPPNEALHKRARNMERALERMEKLSRPILNRKKMDLHLDAVDRSGKDVIELIDISKSFNQQILFSNINLLVQYKENVAIIGENGTGKSTLLKLILEELLPDEGKIRIGSNVKIGYLSQNADHNGEVNTVLEAFRDVIPVTEGEARHILARFLFYGYDVFRKVNQLSGGERMRLRLAQLMYQDVNLLILDEPTNHLDIDSREVLEEALEEFNGTILAVSHDRFFLNRLFSNIYRIEDQTLCHYIGNYDEVRIKMKEKEEYKKLKLANVKNSIDVKVTSPKETNLETEMMIEKNIAKLESELEELESTLYRIEHKMTLESEISLLLELQVEKEKLEEKRGELYQKLEKFYI